MFDFLSPIEKSNEFFQIIFFSEKISTSLDLNVFYSEAVHGKLYEEIEFQFYILNTASNNEAVYDYVEIGKNVTDFLAFRNG